MTRVGGKFLEADFVQEVPSGTVNGSNVNFTLSSAPADPTRVMVWLNGIKQIYTTDYSVSGTTVTFVTAPADGQSVDVAFLREN